MPPTAGNRTFLREEGPPMKNQCAELRDFEMTEQDTILIEPNRLFREGIKHLLAGSPFN